MERAPSPPQSTPRPVLAAWALMAALNLSAGVVIASWPERQTAVRDSCSRRLRCSIPC